MRYGKDGLIVLGIVLLLVTVAVLFVYRPQSRELDSLKEQIKAAEAELDVQSNKAIVVPEVARRVDRMKARYKDFDRRLPRRQELGGFLREISANLGEGSLSDQLIEPGSPKREEFFHTLPIIMKFRGSYLATAQFLKRIGGMERLTRIQKLKIESGSNEEDLSIELQLNIYFTES